MDMKVPESVARAVVTRRPLETAHGYFHQTEVKVTNNDAKLEDFSFGDNFERPRVTAQTPGGHQVTLTGYAKPTTGADISVHTQFKIDGSGDDHHTMTISSREPLEVTKVELVSRDRPYEAVEVSVIHAQDVGPSKT